MSKIGQYLQQHISGEVITSADARRHFATDGSIFTLTPNAVVYPRSENDVRKLTRFTWQLAERGRVVPLTPRGAGTDTSGAALSSGLMVVFPAHMHRIIELDAKSGVVTVEPGINYGKLQQTLQTHGRFLPPFPASLEYSTIGGAVANNTSGDKSFKFGDTKSFVRSLRVVLANGEVIETGRLSKKELNKKLGLSTFEGEIYRSLDTLLEENAELLEKMDKKVSKNTAGYDLLDIKRKDGSIDLTPLFVGSQGTLGVITEISLDSEPYSPDTSLILATFDKLSDAKTAVLALRKMAEQPAAIEMVDGELLALADQLHPNQLKGLIEKPYPKVVLLIEFDGSVKHKKKVLKHTQKILSKTAVHSFIETELDKQEELWKVRHASSALSAHGDGTARALPIIDDGVVPADKLDEFISKVYELYTRAGLRPAVWGHAGDGNFHMRPYLDLSQIGDRQKAFRLMDEYYKLVISLGGSTSGQDGDGRLRAPYLAQLYGQDVYDVLVKVKRIFDPYGTLNPGVIVDSTTEDNKALLRSEYSLNGVFDHLPRS